MLAPQQTITALPPQFINSRFCTFQELRRSRHVIWIKTAQRFFWILNAFSYWANCFVLVSSKNFSIITFVYPCPAASTASFFALSFSMAS